VWRTNKGTEIIHSKRGIKVGVGGEVVMFVTKEPCRQNTTSSVNFACFLPIWNYFFLSISHIGRSTDRRFHTCVSLFVRQFAYMSRFLSDISFLCPVVRPTSLVYVLLLRPTVANNVQFKEPSCKMSWDYCIMRHLI